MTDTTSYSTLIESRPGIFELTLNRPDKHNAFDDAMIQNLISLLDQAESIAHLRLLIVKSEGKHFSAGADLGWMKRMASNSHSENLIDARQLAKLMDKLNHFSRPTLALVQGAAYGGAVGLAACCDLVLASRDARFCLSEVKIGLIPAVISPYVIRAIGERQARRYFLTAEAFTAEEAQAFGLVHKVVDTSADLPHSAEAFIQQLSLNSPQAMMAAKSLIFTVSQQAIDAEIIEETAKRIADIRVSAEGQEGLNAFLNKRQPNWIQENNNNVQ
ncbi:gamma-carboxygeranoyl-CoA hydratase [Nitrincola tibetensis]|uniref:Gamma-carboxygeranoyl-CoA hydratase n=1 Tax=Nitrincola tibetensis TaxID=2219697 RepID=A0A364NK89_9GAMM|nr:enoyl-CoA hydratase-related protein [Nitrincola tibetensis]RAU17496.1 gamma-carboxygeranoyl-CoA hydratase [Nitrincola tibetensis]